jgi:hypothetical protein
VSKLIVATVATIAAIGPSLIAPDTASARSGSVSTAQFHGAPVASHRDGGGLAGRERVLNWRGGAVHNDAVLGRRQRALGYGAGAVYVDPTYGADVNPECQVQRVQISDDYGWRVRSVVVCPPQ